MPRRRRRNRQPDGGPADFAVRRSRRPADHARKHPKPEDWATIVGVVDDVKQWGPSQPAHMAIYRPYLQVKKPFFLSHMTSPSADGRIRSRSRRRFAACSAASTGTSPPQSIASMGDVMAAATAEPAFQARLLGALPRWRCCCRSSAPTACWGIPSRSRRTRSVCGWRSARDAAP